MLKKEVELDLSNYATKFDKKKTANIHISEFVKRAVLASLRSNVDKLDVEELKTVPDKTKAIPINL